MTVRKCNKCDWFWDGADCSGCKMELSAMGLSGKLSGEDTAGFGFEFTDKTIYKLANAVCDEMEKRGILK